MSYPGNVSLAQEIQERILDTFQQTLKLVEDERLKEARLGCDFILRLDPLFEPARWLQDRLDSSDGKIVLDDLREALAAAGPPGANGEPEEPAAAEASAEPDEQAGELEAPAATATEEEEEEEFPESLDEPGADAEPESDTESETGEPAATQAVLGDAEAPTPATPEEVLAAPVAALDTESEQRIQDLLAEGQAAFERAQFQSAIDAWSRIFLIDIDHPEASERIEAARKLKAEAERTVEEAFHEALGKIESGATEAGRAGLERVLEMQPDHLSAREQLEKLDQPPPAGDAETPVAPLEEPDLDSDGELDALAVPAELEAPSAPIPIPKPRPRAGPEPSDKKKVLLYVGAGILALVVVGGWLLVSNWSSMFPNSTETVASEARRPDPIERAEELHAAGQTSTAIAQLKRLPPHDEHYSQAQALVARWEAMAEEETEDAGPTEAELAEFDALVEQARAAQARDEFLRVDELLTRAAAIRPLDEASANLKLLADAELEPIRSLVAIFRQGEWELVLRDLWRMRDKMPDNPDLNRLMVDCYYNLGVRALQRGDTSSAADHFSEALELAGDDDELERASKFARTYQDRPEDLLYRIYVKYLPFR